MQQSIPNLLLKRAHLTPDRPALTFGDKTYSFSDIYERAARVAGHLQARGLRKGQYVGVLLTNHSDTVFLLFALQLIGIKAVMLNNRLTVEELGWQLRDSKASYVVTEKGFESVSQALNQQMPAYSLIFKEELLLSPSPKKTAIVREVRLDDICTVMYTSGTTGHPKGVLQTYGNHTWSAMGSALNLGLHEKDCWLLSVPLFHISGYSILIRSVLYGMRVVLLEKFCERKAISSIQTEWVTIMSAVSTMLVRMIEELGSERLPASFRCMLLGGGPAPKALLEKGKEQQIPIYQTYGMTETSSQIVTLSPEYSMSKIGSAGKALFPSQLKIVDAEGEELPANTPGEIIVKGPNVTSGYLNKDEETKKSIVSGWLYTGDIGYLDDEGFLYVLDRRTDLIISGGENVYPAEVEGVLLSHPNIADAGVVGKADGDWGEVPVAFVVTAGCLDREEIIEFCKQTLANYKVPKQIYFTEMIPRNASKKILRRKLREQWMDEEEEK